jgi:hypothetical protein
LGLPLGLAENASAVAAAAAITRGPSTTATSGSVLAIQPWIRIVDAGGNTDTSSTVDVVASIATGSGNLGGTTSRRVPESPLLQSRVG